MVLAVTRDPQARSSSDQCQFPFYRRERGCDPGAGRVKAWGRQLTWPQAAAPPTGLGGLGENPDLAPDLTSLLSSSEKKIIMLTVP